MSYSDPLNSKDIDQPNNRAARIKDLCSAVDSHKVHQIRCGEHRFVDITIVQTEGRFFVRQYKFGKRSWYNAFIESTSKGGKANGALKVGDLVVPVRGVVPEDLTGINPKVNQAYRKLLGLLYPAMRLTYDTRKHEASTLELIPCFEPEVLAFS